MLPAGDPSPHARPQPTHASIPTAEDSLPAAGAQSASGHRRDDTSALGRPQPPHGPARAAEDSTPDEKAVCFICMDSDAPLLVGQVCGCSSLAVHRSCLERWVNHGENAGTQQFDERLVCLICKQRYRVAYEVTNTPPSEPTSVLARLGAALVCAMWLGVGAGLATLCYNMQKNVGTESALYSVSMASLCLYTMFSVSMYMFLLQRAESRHDERQKRAVPMLHLMGVAIQDDAHRAPEPGGEVGRPAQDAPGSAAMEGAPPARSGAAAEPAERV